MAPDPRDLDGVSFEDTVARPSRRREPIVELAADLEDTITVQRGDRPAAPVAPPTAPVVTAPIATPPVAKPSIPTPPVELVEPPDPSAAPTPAAPIEEFVPEFTGNVWSEPLPEPARPFLVKLADGTLVPLDQPVYLGRKPSVPRIHPGGTPLLVTLDSPQREVSSTHLELTTVGGTIVASDMKSTNGSVLRVPGSEPRTLLGGESAVVTPGTVIELGDGNLVLLLAPDPDADTPASTGAPA